MSPTTARVKRVLYLLPRLEGSALMRVAERDGTVVMESYSGTEIVRWTQAENIRIERWPGEGEPACPSPKSTPAATTASPDPATSGRSESSESLQSAARTMAQSLMSDFPTESSDTPPTDSPGDTAGAAQPSSP